MANNALIVGAGSGLSASLARRFTADGMKVALASRDPGKLAALCSTTGAVAFACDATQPDQVAKLFDDAIAALGPLDVVVFNPSARAGGPTADLDPAAVLRALTISAFGGFLVGQAAARHMLPRRAGAILFTGASASVKG
ncbi:MAG TPA: SDR family NAD(P)-dependent oxidoreductase, partial [Acetobacteraceae bacterium]|nr:SDR family NAD(P)-dependent oxidoreductase [Acetobacteraceae bacterium]